MVVSVVLTKRQWALVRISGMVLQCHCHHVATSGQVIHIIYIAMRNKNSRWSLPAIGWQVYTGDQHAPVSPTWGQQPESGAFLTHAKVPIRSIHFNAANQELTKHQRKSIDPEEGMT